MIFDTELKRCPFCGERSAVIATRPCDGKWIEYPFCEKCGAECMTAEEWNTRPIEDELRAEIWRLRVEIRQRNKDAEREERWRLYCKQLEAEIEAARAAGAMP